MRIEWTGDVAVVAVAGVVDLIGARHLTTTIGALFGPRPVGLVVDLTDVEFLAVAGMTVLLSIRQRITPEVRFGIVADGRATGRPMRLVGLDRVIPLYPTLEAALRDVAEIDGPAPTT